MYGSDSWPIKVLDERRLDTAEIRMLSWMCGITWKINPKTNNKTPSDNIRPSLKVVEVVEKLRSNRLRRYGHVVRKDETIVARGVLDLQIEGYKRKGKPKMEWVDCVNNDMKLNEETIA